MLCVNTKLNDSIADQEIRQWRGTPYIAVSYTHLTLPTKQEV